MWHVVLHELHFTWRWLLAIVLEHNYTCRACFSFSVVIFRPGVAFDLHWPLTASVDKLILIWKCVRGLTLTVTEKYLFLLAKMTTWCRVLFTRVDGESEIFTAPWTNPGALQTTSLLLHLVSVVNDRYSQISCKRARVNAQHSEHFITATRQDTKIN